jgi:pSer/pThr/pTyr-binding forkhead associated (FHA) protein
MAKLVILSKDLAGRAHELNVDRTTIGRVEDNTFQIAEPSVSSHHCEVHLRGHEIFIRDLNSTNGTFIGGEKIAEGVLKPGQTLRLGNVELRLEAEGGTAPATPAAPAAPSKKSVEPTMVIPRGISLDQLEQSGRIPGFDSSTVFTKKTNKVNKWFLIGGIVIGLVIVVLLIIVFSYAGHK